MTARSKSSSRLPAGLSPAEEARWWDEHRDYWDTNDGQDERVEPVSVRRTSLVNLRLPIDMIDRLTGEAAERSLSPQTLMQMWLQERLDTESRARAG